MLRFLILILCSLLLCFSVAGCASLLPKEVQKLAADGVNKYCSTFSYEQRVTVIRPEFNTLIAPNRASVSCFGDPENPKP